ncbi:nucleic acid-binding protein [Xylariaceae sp. FL0662B]|nr:nucleic acid-binding protein [Xylariaceae sp. FL0662B]
MSSLKRKDAPGASSAAKVSKSNGESRPSKRSKSGQTSTKTDTKPIKPPKSSEPKPAGIPTITRLKEEEPLFPRGGGSVLSPLEHKQISIQAKQDVLFEQASGQDAKKADRTSKKKKVRAPKDRKSSNTYLGEDSVKIESLNYKRLVKGSLVLGQVTEINSLDIVLALPNNLFGHVPITAISDVLNERIAAEADDDGDEDDVDDDLDLKKLFHVGQYVRAYVTSTIEESTATSAKPRKHIEMSLRPEHTNTGLSSQDIVVNSTVMATVNSAEAHGFVMELGLSDSNLRGFLPRKELAEDIPDSQMHTGNAILCLVTGKSANGKVAQLTTIRSKIGKIQNVASEATTINTFLPGSAVELMISEVTKRGISGQIMGSLDVTADLIHSGLGPKASDLESKYKVGKKVKARIICTFPTAKDPKLGISFLDHVVSLQSKLAATDKLPYEVLPISSVVEQCTVTKVEPEIGLFVDVGVEGVPGFVHISRVKDGKVDMLSESSGPFKTGSIHRGRVVGYNAIDGMFHLSFEKQVLEQPFLRIEDIPIGEVVSGEIEKIMINQEGVSGLLVKLADNIVGFVPEMHLADVRLQHPEKKFREGLKVKARVLSTDLVRRQVKLTLKKTLVNSEAVPLKSFEEVVVGMQVPGTIIKVLPNGAVVQFYGSLRGFLPVSEMSEAYIKDPKEHFRVGQVLSVHVLNFDAEAQKLFVSCKDPSAFGLDKQNALKKLKLGAVVSAKVVQKTEDDVFVELLDSSLKAMLSARHLADRPSKCQSTLKHIRVGQTLHDLVVLDKNESRRFIALSKQPSLVKASQDGRLLTSLEEAKVGELRQGFVRNVTATAAFIQFCGQLTALLPKSKLPQEDQTKTGFGLEKFQLMLVRIDSIDREHGRIVVASSSSKGERSTKDHNSSTDAVKVDNPVDERISSMDDLFIGKITKAKVTSVKSTQLNVKLADNIQGRVDVSQVFDSWDKISNPKAPLSNFRVNNTISVRILGIHDARNHRFLPISHRSTHSVLELSAKPSDTKKDSPKTLSLDALEPGSTHLGFVNNVQKNSLWVSLSPNVRGKINTLEISDDVSQLEDLASNFPVGSALRVRVLSVNPAEGRLDLSARSSGSSSNLIWENVKQNMVLPGRITKINERQILVQLGDIVSGPVHLVDISDDYDDANTLAFSKNDVIRISVVDVDKSNKKVRLSTRPSRVLNSSLPVKDREITKISQISAGDIIRGFVKNVSDKGVFVGLGGDVTAMVRISDLSDRFLKDWKDEYQIDQLVKGRITSVDPTVGHIQMSLKASVVEKDFVPLINYHDLRKGQVVTGKIRKVEEYGAFIVVDGSANVSGLCHRSEMAEKPVEDARKLFTEGDAVKAIILKLDQQKKRISFGLKPSYFEDDASEMSIDGGDEDEDDAGAALFDEEDESDQDEDDEMDDTGSAVLISGTDNDPDVDSEDDDTEMIDGAPGGATDGVDALDAGGFDWSGNALDKVDAADENTDEDEGTAQERKKKRRKPQIEVDKSGDLDAFGPRTAVDYEQLLNRQPNSSSLWIEYIAFQLQVSELAKAREVAERAITTISSTEETEKLNVWIAYLNLEVRFGNEDTVEEVFRRACQVNDQQEVYQRLASIYVQEDKAEASRKADDIFQALVKKFGAISPDVWYNYAHWLHAVQNQPERARALLSRATQALPNHARLPLMTKFAALEFNSPHKNPELGRTMFESLLSTFPKRFDLWHQLLDHEDVAGADKTVVRDVFERATKVKGLKARAAKKWFKRWADWEEANGDAKSRERVSAKAAEWVRAKAEAKASKNDEDEDGDDE